MSSLDLKKIELPASLPVFPLSGVLLLPGGILPLNIFEPRYVQMIDDALASPGRVIGMIQPSKPGEKTLKKVGCLGRISTFNEAEDNRYLITLSGTIRFEVKEELNTTTPYRQIIPYYDCLLYTSPSPRDRG